MVRSGPWREIIGHLASVGWFDGSRSALGRGRGRTCRGWHTVSILTLSSSMTTISRRVRPTSLAAALRLRVWLAPLLGVRAKDATADYFRSFVRQLQEKSWLSLWLWGRPATSNAAMDTRSKRRTTEPVVDKVRRGEISVVVALAEELPDLFEADILSKLDIWATLNLAQVSKSFNHAVWSVGGVRSMESGWDVNRSMVTEGFPALHHAVVSGQMAVVKVLIEAGADVNMTTDTQLTPLHVAAIGKQREAVVNILIDASADVNKATNDGWTPLHWAVLHGQGVHADVIGVGWKYRGAAETSRCDLRSRVNTTRRTCNTTAHRITTCAAPPARP